MENFNKLPRWLVWEVAIPLTFLNGWLLYQIFQIFQTPLTIFISAMLLAFLLDYPIQQLEKRSLKKGVSISLILLGTIAVLGIISFLLIPILLGQLKDLSIRLPQWLEAGDQQFIALDNWLLSQQIPLDFTNLIDHLSNSLPDEFIHLPDQILDILLGATDRLIEILITGVLTLYLLLHGDEFWKGLFKGLPSPLSTAIPSAFQEQFRNYFVGQGTIALMMAITLTILFFLFQVPYWLVAGTSIGLLALIPFGDIVATFTLATIVSFKSILIGGEVIAISLITDQIIDNAIAPKILGHLSGLNPIWILISLLIGSQFGGVLGLLLAVPVAGSCKRIFELAVVKN